MLDALVEHDHQRPKETPLAASDTLAPFVEKKAE